MPSEPTPGQTGRLAEIPARPGATRRALALLGRGVGIIGINLLIFVALLIPVELWFGQWFTGPGSVSLFDATPGRVEIRPSSFYPAGAIITNSRDRFGFRGGAQDPAKIDVLVLGGSTTAERYIDDKDIWTAQLQTL